MCHKTVAHDHMAQSWTQSVGAWAQWPVNWPLISLSLLHNVGARQVIDRFAVLTHISSFFSFLLFHGPDWKIMCWTVQKKEKGTYKSAAIFFSIPGTHLLMTHLCGYASPGNKGKGNACALSRIEGHEGNVDTFHFVCQSILESISTYKSVAIHFLFHGHFSQRQEWPWGKRKWTGRPLLSHGPDSDLFFLFTCWTVSWATSRYRSSENCPANNDAVIIDQLLAWTISEL